MSLIVDARDAAVVTTKKGAVRAGTGLRLHVLRDGMTRDLSKR